MRCRRREWRAGANLLLVMMGRGLRHGDRRVVLRCRVGPFACIRVGGSGMYEQLGLVLIEDFRRYVQAEVDPEEEIYL